MSDRSEKPFELARDGLGILLFTAGAFMAVLVALALASSEPLEKGEGTAALARLWAASVGLLPGLLFSSGCALLGARLFLSGERASPRGAGRIAIVAVGAAVLLGAFSRTAGGWVGDATTGAIARGSNVLLAALAGLAAFGAAARFAWPRRSGAAAGSSPASTGTATVPPDDGVSPEEAAELIPFELPRSSADSRMVSHVTQATSPDTPVQREDVRLRAGIPEGARALSPTHEPAPVTAGPSPLPAIEPGPEPELDDALAAPALHERAPDPEAPLAADRVDEDLALEEEPYRLEDDEGSFELVEPEVEPELGAELDLIEADPLDPASEELGPEPATAAANLANVPRPSWEQSSLFDVEEEREPAVDAYGTPLGAPEEERQVLLQELETANETLATGIEDLELPGGEHDVVLTPVPPKRKRTKVRDPKPPKERSSRAPEPATGRSRLLAEIGCLLVERGRVAVSMLQKQYDMDFDEATRVLDELQELGLIGPYLGGQRRDILLTRDEWLEKVSSL